MSAGYADLVIREHKRFQILDLRLRIKSLLNIVFTFVVLLWNFDDLVFINRKYLSPNFCLPRLFYE